MIYIHRIDERVNRPLSISPVSGTLHASMSLAREDVAALAHLARIALNDEELSRAERELDGVLQYVDRLQKVDTSGVDEAAPDAVVATAFRPDEAMSCDAETRDVIVENFPAKQNGFLKAPAVFERPKK